MSSTYTSTFITDMYFYIYHLNLKYVNEITAMHTCSTTGMEFCTTRNIMKLYYSTSYCKNTFSLPNQINKFTKAQQEKPDI